MSNLAIFLILFGAARPAPVPAAPRAPTAPTWPYK